MFPFKPGQNRVLGKSIAGASTLERRTSEQHNNGQAGGLAFIIYFA